MSARTCKSCGAPLVKGCRPTRERSGDVSDYPLDLSAAHGRIAAYRAALEDAMHAITEAYPYVNGVALDASGSPWRQETARDILARIDSARERAALELAVTQYAYMIDKGGETYPERAYGVSYER